MKWTITFLALFTLITVESFAQNSVKKTFILEGGKNYKGKMKINPKKNRVTMRAFVPDSAFGFTGTCEFIDDSRIRIILDEEYRKSSEKEGFLIEGDCFTLKGKYRFCEK